MQANWVRLLERYSIAPADAYPVFDVLIAAYSAPERHYHTLEHLCEMFRVAGRLASQADDPAAVQLAIWFHDAVYDTRAKDNEVRSGELAVEMLGPIGVSAVVVDRVVALIRSTAHLASAELPSNRDAAVMLDADLAILGATEERYRRYARDVRREYDWVSDDEYRVGRAAVLKMFLARPRIYNNQIMSEEGEGPARDNLRAELKELNEH